MPSHPWHCLTPEAAAQALATAPDQGLSAEEAARRLASGGPNLLREAPPRPPWRMLLDQFRDFMILMLLVAALISGAIGEVVDSAAIVAILLVNACIGFVQEYRAAQAMQALKRLGAARARVLRGGAFAEIDAAGLVAGDVVMLEAGDLVPADVRLVELAAFEVDEAVLTGESVPAEKQVEALADPALGVADRTNLSFKGTVVTRGRARALVYATGMQTELGRIAGLLRQDEGERTPLQRRLSVLGTRLAYVALAICALVFVFGALRGESLLLMFMTSVSLAVAAVPEALPAVVTVALALGAAKMVRSQALIRRLPAVETLGSVSYICSDKTGTLTQNRMRVESLYVAGAPGIAPAAEPPTDAAHEWLLRAAALNNDAHGEAPESLHGDPTETALLAAAQAAGYGKARLEREYPRVAELPFDSARKMMSTVHSLGAEQMVLVKGAPERVLERCVRQHGTDLPFVRADALQLAVDMAADGMRVIAFACRRLEHLPLAGATEAIETELEFLGLFGMIDAPRPEAEEAVRLCQEAGIAVVMITGDHPATAAHIARRLGIAPAGAKVVTGAELARMSEAEFDARVRELRVYARVDPEQKIRIVKALQQRGECVAMTGDGVNDAPALRRAEIGVAMGRAGTEVAREASDMVLLDDNFATIVRAVREGRRIYDNIRRFVLFVLAGNTGEILAIAAAPLFGLPLPLLPIHILWVNLVTDGLPGLALAAERADADVMRQAPRPRDESIFARGLWQRILWVGLLIGAMTLGVQAWAWQGGSPHWQTMAFCVLTFAQMGLALGVRSERRSLASLGLFSNPALLGAVALTVVLQFAVVYLPAANAVFRTQPLAPSEMLLCVAAGLSVLLAVELNKWRMRVA
ncbi:MAG: cation-translocating P-type ATPase [Burkholderiales bacterium]|nr:cation-translocating P-type ATPase [Burkholderiales bacterium]